MTLKMIFDEELKELLLDLKRGYPLQMNQLQQGLDQMLAQKGQLEEQIPMLEAEIEKLQKKMATLDSLMPEEEE
tara:strand:- start:246 stop:467 length:222 start_codon:yes stop_codon:yes gene_type:complete